MIASTLPSTLPSRVAIHEAGHAVVHLATGYTVSGISIALVGGDGSLGRVMAQDPRHKDSHPGETMGEYLDRMDEWTGHAAALHVAGLVAEWTAFGSGQLDACDAEELIKVCLFAGDDEGTHLRVQNEAYALAKKILRERWPAVLALAAALDERGTLTSAEAEEVLRGVPA